MKKKTRKPLMIKIGADTSEALKAIKQIEDRLISIEKRIENSRVSLTVEDKLSLGLSRSNRRAS